MKFYLNYHTSLEAKNDEKFTNSVFKIFLPLGMRRKGKKMLFEKLLNAIAAGLLQKITTELDWFVYPTLEIPLANGNLPLTIYYNIYSQSNLLVLSRSFVCCNNHFN